MRWNTTQKAYELDAQPSWERQNPALQALCANIPRRDPACSALKSSKVTNSAQCCRRARRKSWRGPPALSSTPSLQPLPHIHQQQARPRPHFLRMQAQTQAPVIRRRSVHSPPFLNHPPNSHPSSRSCSRLCGLAMYKPPYLAPYSPARKSSRGACSTIFSLRSPDRLRKTQHSKCGLYPTNSSSERLCEGRADGARKHYACRTSRIHD